MRSRRRRELQIKAKAEPFDIRFEAILAGMALALALLFGWAQSGWTQNTDAGQKEREAKQLEASAMRGKGKTTETAEKREISEEQEMAYTGQKKKNRLEPDFPGRAMYTQPIVGMDVRSSTGDEIGEVENIIMSRDGAGI